MENDKLIPLKGKDNEELYLYSLSNVSLSSHRNKDWENVDMKSDIEDITNYFKSHPDSLQEEAHTMVINGISRKILLNGLKSRNVEGEMVLVTEQVSLSPDDTLEAMLENFEKRVTSDILSKTICLMHGPPYVINTIFKIFYYYFIHIKLCQIVLQIYTIMKFEISILLF